LEAKDKTTLKDVDADKGDFTDSNVDKMDVDTFNGGHAAGGSVYGGRATLVGELGPEIFTPDTNGYILNNATTARMLSLLDPRVDPVLRLHAVSSSVQPSSWMGEGPSSWMGEGSSSIQGEPSFGGATSNTTNYNYYNLTIHTETNQEDIIADYNMLRAMNGDS
jgi:hypothetical protein